MYIRPYCMLHINRVDWDEDGYMKNIVAKLLATMPHRVALFGGSPKDTGRSGVGKSGQLSQPHTLPHPLRVIIIF